MWFHIQRVSMFKYNIGARYSNPRSSPICKECLCSESASMLAIAIYHMLLLGNMGSMCKDCLCSNRASEIYISNFLFSLSGFGKFWGFQVCSELISKKRHHAVNPSGWGRLWFNRPISTRMWPPKDSSNCVSHGLDLLDGKNQYWT